MTPEEYRELKKRLIAEVIDNQRVTVPNPSFEACTNPENGIKEGNCSSCKKYHRSTHDLCNRGEMIVETKPVETLIDEALDLLMDELGGNLLEKLSLRKQR